MADSAQISVTLPKQAVAIIENQLIKTGLFGSTRGEVARQLILDRLKELNAQGVIKLAD